jgi:6-pyruvoyltetrahydropterin/6-carboxytetrahydropterin synthase
MIIRKTFHFEGAHIVRNCSSVRCRENIHGHSYEVEVFLKSDKLDKGYMVMDFILLDKVSEFIHCFDHSYSLWDKEKTDIKEAVYKINYRIAEIPVSPSAEGYALMFFYVIDKIIKNTSFRNDEGNVQLHSVRVHETKSGYAEAFREDHNLVNFTLDDILFSEGIKKEWKSPWWENLKEEKKFENRYL